MNRDIACRSNLLAALHTQYKGTHTDPLIIPPKTSISVADLENFSTYHKRDKQSFVAWNDYNSALHITDKMKDAVSYTQLLEQLDMPKEITKRFTQLATSVALRSSFFKKLQTNITIIDQCQRVGYETPSLKITHDGYHFAHNILFDERQLRLWQIEKKPAEIQKTLSHYDLKYAIYFSRSGRYCIVRGGKRNLYPFVYDIPTNTQYPLILPDYIDTIRKIRISPNNKHIMICGLKENMDRRFALWSLDERNQPHPILLTAPIWDKFVADTIFHSDNKHLICNFYAKKLSLCSLAKPDELTHETKTNDKDYFSLLELVTTTDGNYVLAKSTSNKNIPDMLFSLCENTQMPPVAIPHQSQQQRPWVKNRYIPHKQLFTHIINNGTTLQLLDTNMEVVAHHSTKIGAQIRALAVEPTGDYIASGYSDGTVIIWDLTRIKSRIIGTKITVPGGPIRSLMFSANQLLLCQTGKKIWNNFSDELEAQASTALLCDVNGNTIIDFGPTIASIMSKKGNRIITISEELQPINVELGCLSSFVTATIWYLHNKKVQQKLEEYKTLSELFKHISSMDS